MAHALIWSIPITKTGTFALAVFKLTALATRYIDLLFPHVAS